MIPRLAERPIALLNLTPAIPIIEKVVKNESDVTKIPLFAKKRRFSEKKTAIP